MIGLENLCILKKHKHFILKMPRSDHVVAAEHPLWCFQCPVTAGKGINSHISACFILPISFLFTHPVGRAQEPKSCETVHWFIGCGVMGRCRGQTFSATADGTSHSQQKWMDTFPTWIWFGFNEMNLLSGVDFIFALDMMGYFQMYFTCWRQWSACHMRGSGPRHQRWSSG